MQVQKSLTNIVINYRKPSVPDGADKVYQTRYLEGEVDFDVFSWLIS